MNSSLSELTVGEWVAQLEPPAPDALALRLRQLLAASAEAPAARASETCVDVGVQVLGSLLASCDTSRSGALDLLAVDALVTCAFEAAADRPESIEALTSQAMADIAAVAMADSN